MGRTPAGGTTAQQPSSPGGELVGRGAVLARLRFLGVISGAVPLEEYMTPRNLTRIIGLRGMARLTLGRLRRRPPQPRASLTGAGAATDA